MEIKKVVIDTNVLLINIDVLKDYETVLMPTVILEELDGLKKDEGELGYRARQAIKGIEKAENIVYSAQDFYNCEVYGWDKHKRDNQIIFCAKENNCTLISNDVAVRAKANSQIMNVPTKGYTISQCDIEYSGHRVVVMDDEELASWYGSEKTNKWNLNIGEYLLIKSKSEDKIVDVWTMNAEGFRGLKYAKKIESSLLGKFISKDIYQNCALDSLFNNQLTMIKGKAGTGKSLIALSYAMNQIEKGLYDRLIVFTNTVATKNSAKLGYYPGTRDEKLLDSQVGNMLASKFGDRMEVDRLIKQDKLLLLPFSDIRGYDTTGMNAICWIVEAQNLDIELMRLAVQRVGDDCQLIIDGDYSTQVDCSAFEGDRNGMRRMSEVFRGQDFYGEVELQQIYRSKLAEIADKL